MDRPELKDAIARLRAAAPLVHNITNFVAMNATANALLAIGASPAMIDAIEEVADFTPQAAALVVNIGTLSRDRLASMECAAAKASEIGVPWILDPVAAGSTPYRTAAAMTLAQLRPAVIRGNASEILTLGGDARAVPKGVESVHRPEAARAAAGRLAVALGTVIAVTGATDYVTDGRRLAAVANGHPLLTRVTATGCMATALIGAFLGAGLAPFDAAVAGLVTLGVAAEIAAAGAAGPGSFQVALMDALYRLDDAIMTARARVQ
jgi:hydroxyethylthiazole kinase